MTLRFSTSRALGAALALTLGGVAGAQTPVRKDVPPSQPTRMPVSKDTPAPRDTTSSMPAPAPAPTPAPAPAPMPVDTMTSTTTTTTTTTTSTGDVPAPAMSMHMRNGWYFGVAGAGEIPQNELRNYYKTGWGVEVPIGWDPVNSPLGLRVNLGYARLTGKSGLRTIGSTSSTLQTLEDPQIFQAVGDAKLRLHWGPKLLSGLYAVGGAGAYYFRNYTNTLNLTTNPGTAGGTGSGASGGNVTNTFNSEDKTRFGANVGGGLQFGIGNAALYVESRYVRIFTPNRDSDMVPVALGLTWNW